MPILFAEFPIATCLPTTWNQQGLAGIELDEMSLDFRVETFIIFF